MSDPQRRHFWEASVPPAWAMRALAKGIISPDRFEALIALSAASPALRRRARRHRGCSCRRRGRHGCTSWGFHGDL